MIEKSRMESVRWENSVLSSLIFERSGKGVDFGADPSDECQHGEVHEIGCDFDKDGMFPRLVRCQRCGLLKRQYLPMLQQ
jgi:hypothetical protein